MSYLQILLAHVWCSKIQENKDIKSDKESSNLLIFEMFQQSITK